MDKKECRRKAVEMLDNYKNHQVAIRMLQADLQMIDGLVMNSNMAVTYDKPVTGKTNKVVSRTEMDVIQMEQQRNRLKGQIMRLQNQVDKVEIALNHMDPPYKTLIRLKYMEHKRWSEIYPMFNYSEEYVRGKLHEAALRMFTEYLFPEVYMKELLSLDPA